MGHKMETSKFLSRSLFCIVSKNTQSYNSKTIIFRWNTILKQEFYTEKTITFKYVWRNNLKSVSLYLRILQYTMINQQKKAIYRIKAVLAEKQLSGKWLANEIGRTENTVSRWCSNKVQPFLENLLEIAKALKVDVRDLLSSTEE